MKLSLKEIKKAADQELIRRDYDPSKMIATYDEDNSHRYIPMLLNFVENTPELKAKIEGHDYIVVLYKRKLKKGHHIAGGGIDVFVDRDTGDILLSLVGK